MMKRLIVIPLCLLVFMLCTSESCKEKKANKVVQKLLSTWIINVLKVDGDDTNKISSSTTDATMIKNLRIDFDKYIAEHGDLFWFATYGDDSQEQLEGRYEVSSDSKTLAITLYFPTGTSIPKILDGKIDTKTYFLFSTDTKDIKNTEFIINGEYPSENKTKTFYLEGTKF